MRLGGKMAAPREVNPPPLSKFAVGFLNDHFGDDVKSLSIVKDVFTRTKASKDSLESQVCKF